MPRKEQSSFSFNKHCLVYPDVDGEYVAASLSQSPLIQLLKDLSRAIMPFLLNLWFGIGMSPTHYRSPLIFYCHRILSLLIYHVDMVLLNIHRTRC